MVTVSDKVQVKCHNCGRFADICVIIFAFDNKVINFMPESHRISIRVHTPLLEWIEQQATEGESPSKVVQRLIVELATNDGVVLGDRIDQLDNRISQIENTIKEITEELAYKKPKSDSELLAELEELVQNATDNADSGYFPRHESFSAIWERFWITKERIEKHVDYSAPRTTYEADINAYLDAAKRQIK